MSERNFEKMRQLAEEFFGTKNDPEQISVDEETMSLLKKIHPETLSEERNDDGPIAWILVVPTTRKVMEEFIIGRISEKDLLTKTPPGVVFDSLYLCSALVLPEERGKGVATTLARRTIRAILRDHPIQFLFFWKFSDAGERLAASIAREFHLPLLRRN